jgi:hypothetical protein
MPPPSRRLLESITGASSHLSGIGPEVAGRAAPTQPRWRGSRLRRVLDQSRPADSPPFGSSNLRWLSQNAAR